MAGKVTRRPIERFMEKFVVDEETGCWVWMHASTILGYGMFAISRSKCQMAYRWSYEHFVGPIPEGLVMDHLCRNPRCVNPEHVEPVTHTENVRRGISFIPQQKFRTHCPQGHPYDETNTYTSRSGSRHCKACGRERDRARSLRRKAA